MASPRSVWSWLGMVALLAVGVVVGRLSPKWLAPWDERSRSPAVITQVRELSRLEGVSFHVERVVDLKDEQRMLFGLVAADDAILLVASGDVVAGVDLGLIQPSDVSVAPDGRSVTLRLPRAEVFSARLDNARTYVHSRKTDLLAQRGESLETRARQAAEDTLRAAAEDAGILKRAEDSVARTVSSLVRALGFENVRVEFGELS
ncbi:MAG TPA: DUF4230 domain-containing protein [Polyangiaceae bacterium]|nr:DUF4230 domain-containing protein [Polyangiaceae bacterium]